MEDFTLETAENVLLHYDIATAGSRSAAFLIDYIIILMISLLFNILMELSQLVGGFSVYFIALFYLIVGTLSWTYFVASEMVLNGSSIGKKILGLRVIKENGSPIDLIDSLTRNFVRYVDLLPGTCLVGFLTMMLNEKSRRLGDFAAGTLVVRVPSVYLDKLPLEETPYDMVVRASPHLFLITSEEYQLMRDYLTERYRIVPDKSSTIAQNLATYMAAKLNIDPPTELEKCLQLIKSCIKYYK
jgi:uncharacterized RDD family membrane protein YckC